MTKNSQPVSLEKFNPNGIAKQLRVRNARDVLALASDVESYPSLAGLRRDYGSESVEAMIGLYLLDLKRTVPVKNAPSAELIEIISSEIVTEFWQLTMLDIHVVFRRVKLGEYGELYESWNLPKVMSWFRAYWRDRCALAEQDSINKQYQDSNDPRSSERMRQQFDALEKKFRKNKI